MNRRPEGGGIGARLRVGVFLPETAGQQRIALKRFARRLQSRRIGQGHDPVKERPLAACAFGEQAAEGGGKRRATSAAGAAGAVGPEGHEHSARRSGEARAGVGDNDAVGTGGADPGGEADRQAVIWHGCQIVTSGRQGKSAPWPVRTLPLT